jgi:hypothetical protein
LVKLDFGCGKNVRDGFEGVDCLDFGQTWKVDLVNDKWPWEDGSVEEAHASHFIEHLEAQQRITFINQLYLALVPGGKCTIITPHWASCRAYGDMTHKWPPVSEFWFYYLSKEWRKVNAPHDDVAFNPQGYSCDFEATWGYNLSSAIAVRNPEFQQFAIQNYKEAASDLVATLVKK